MAGKINRKQYEELCESEVWDITEEFHKKLEQIAGITTKVYTYYSYFDEAGNYIGNSIDYTVTELLNNAYIDVDNA